MSYLPRKKYSVLIVTIAILLMIGSSTIAGHQSPLYSSPSSTRQTVTPSLASRIDQLGIDCGLGSTVAAVNGTGFAVAPTETGTAELLNRCTWIGDVGQSGLGSALGTSDGSTEPLVSDQDEASPGGGGFTANVVILQNATSSVNGFDLQVQWSPAVLRMVEFDQSGVLSNCGSAFTAISTIDNVNGIAELGQVVLGTPIGGNLTLFRIRFDVVGVGVTNLHIVNVSGGLTNPNTVVHQTIDGSFDSESFHDTAHTLNWAASFTNSTPINPGGSNSFRATVSGGTAPYTFNWQFDSCNQSAGVTCVFSSEATGSPVTVTIPTATLHANRVTLQVTDSASHMIALTQHIPLTLAVSKPASFATGSSQTITGFWMGGLPNYSGSMRFCPGLSSQTQVCAKPIVAIPAGVAQTLPVTGQIYNFAGLFTGTLTITDTEPASVFAGPTTIKFLFVVNVTGTPQAYTITLSSNNTAPSINQHVQYTAVAHYASTYPTVVGATQFRSATISVKFLFGDGGSATQTITMSTGGANSTTVVHQYSKAGTFTASAIGLETATNALSQIQETSNSIAETVGSAVTPPSVSINCPTTGTVGTAITCTATGSNGTPPYTFAWTATGGTPSTGAGTSFSTTYSAAGAHTISVVLTDAASSTAAASASVTITDFTVTASPTTVSVAQGSPGTSTITAAGISGFTGTVTLSDTISPSTGMTCSLSPTSIALSTTITSGTSTLSCTGSTTGSFTVTVTGTSGSTIHTATVTYTVTAPANFNVAASPTTVSVVQGSSGTSTITVSAVNGFTGTISLSDVVSPSTGLTCTLSPTSVALTSTTTSGTSTLSCTGSATGSFTVTVTGTSGSLSHSATVTYTVTAVPNFTVTASPTTVSVAVGSPGTSTITVAATNGFTGTVGLTDTVSPSTGLTCTLSPTSVTLSTTTSSGTSVLSCTASTTGSFTVTVPRTSASLSHSATVSYSVTAAPDFTVTASPITVPVVVGSAGTSAVSVNAINGFTGTVTLSDTVSPSAGLTCSLSPPSVALHSTTTSGTSSLSCAGSP